MSVLFIVFLFFAALILAGLIFQALGVSRDRHRFPPPGTLVDIGGTRLHIIQSGQGTPAVVLESGISASCLNWTDIRTRVSQFSTCYSYDRASLGWSDAADTARVPSRIIEELHALLQASQVQSPYVLAGHSFGGLVVRAYAQKYGSEVAGLVLIDPLSASEWLEPSIEQKSRLQNGVNLSRRGAMLAQLGIVRLSLALLAGGARLLPQAIAKLSSGKGESTISRIVGEVRKMPPETWPMIRAHWCSPKSFRGMASYLAALPASSAECVHLRDIPNIPITMLSASKSTVNEVAEREAIARNSIRGRHIIAAQSGHWIHLDEPELVVKAIQDVVEFVRAARPHD